MPFHSAGDNFSVEIAGKTDIGCVRTNNEDAFGYDAALGIFVLCDGMGGQAAGELASELSVSTVLSYFAETQENGGDLSPFPVEDLSEDAQTLGCAFQAANRAIREAVTSNTGLAGMGTTIVAVLLRQDKAAIAHVGDSRIYLIRDHSIEQLTKDHSLVMEHVRRGILTMDEAANSPIQNVITRALGAAETVEPDLADLQLVAGDTLLLCSDGLTRHLADHQILSFTTRASSLEAACDDLIASAKAAGGSDNVTCLLIRVS